MGGNVFVINMIVAHLKGIENKINGIVICLMKINQSKSLGWIKALTESIPQSMVI